MIAFTQVKMRPARGLFVLVVCSASAILLVAAPAAKTAAQPKAPAVPVRQAKAAEEPARPGAVDLGRTRVYILVDKKGRFGHEHGVVGKLKSGHINLDAAKDAGELVFDMSSFTADTAQARQYVGLGGESDAGTRQQVTDNMLSAAVLDANRFPTAKFAITSAQRVKAKQGAGKLQYKLEGKFTLHGQTQPLTLLAGAEELEGRVRLRGDFTILQTDFGIRPFTKAFGAVGVANELKIWGDVSLQR